MNQYRVVLDNNVIKQIKKDFKSGLITRNDLITIQAWIDLIETRGIEAMQLIHRYRDHELSHNWKGYRSASFSRMGRIIYKVINGQPVIIKIVKVTGGHNYEK